MKRFYIILAAAAICATLLPTQAERLPLNPASPETTPPNEVKSFRPSRIAAQAPADATWETAGKGMWKEYLLDQVLPPNVLGSAWEVTLEQAKEYPGYYRVLPYATGTPLAEALGQADDENYVYINATNPSKVYIEEFFAFGYIMISNRVAENQWTQDATGYGTLKDNVITFPAKSFAYATYDTGQYAYCDVSGYFQIALPGGELKDYLFELDTPTCVEGNEMPISITAGEDIAKVKMITSQGYFRSSESNDRTVAERGQEIDPSTGFTTLTFNDNAPVGIYTTIAVGLRADGSIAGSRCAYSHVLEKNDADWSAAGTATFNEGILTTVYSEVTPQVLTCQAEQSISTPGRYRLVNPYAGHSWMQAYDDLAVNHDHNHYIYINAVNPSSVYIEAAPLGMNTDGETSLYSLAGYYTDAGQSSTALNQGLFGKLVKEDGELIFTMPDGSLMFAEKNYDYGTYYNVGQDFIVVIKDGTDAIEEAGIEEEAGAPAEYYNLQGIRIAHPRPGQLVIERRGGKTTKTIVK